jgi:hypothetical protein
MASLSADMGAQITSSRNRKIGFTTTNCNSSLDTNNGMVRRFYLVPSSPYSPYERLAQEASHWLFRQPDVVPHHRIGGDSLWILEEAINNGQKRICRQVLVQRHNRS